jgi:hypothetical protein
MDAEEREVMTDAVYDIVCGAGPTVDNELAIYALVDVLAIILAGGAQGKPASNIDLMATAIGETIAEKAHRLLGPGHGVAQ